MRAHVGDRIVLAAEHVDEPTRDGEVLEVRGADGGPPFVVRWADGHTGLIYPGPGAVLHLGVAGDETAAKPAPASTGPADQAPTQHLREWQVRVSLLESGDDTKATVVLVADPPDRLSAKGSSHRATDDLASRQIGDEIAVARALRHLADQLIVEAERDIEQRTGEEAHVRTT